MLLAQETIVAVVHPEAVWRVRADVANWNMWDDGVEFRGPLGWLFAKLIGKGIRTGLPAAVRAVVAKAEGTHA